MKKILWLHLATDENLSPERVKRLTDAMCTKLGEQCTIVTGKADVDEWLRLCMYSWPEWSKSTVLRYDAFLFTDPYCKGIYDSAGPGGAIGCIHYASEAGKNCYHLSEPQFGLFSLAYIVGATEETEPGLTKTGKPKRAKIWQLTLSSCL